MRVDVGRADCLVRLLGVLGFAGVFARRSRQVVGAKAILHMVADAVDCLLRHLHAVGPHIGDQAGGLAADIDALIQALGQAHRLLGAKTQFPGCLLLQCRGGERRRRVALDAAALDGADGEGASLDRGFGGQREGFVVEVELVEPLAVQMGQPRSERGAARGQEQRLDGPVLACPEDLDLGLAVADQAQCDGLDAAGTAAAWQFAPQHRRQRKAHQIVQRPTGHVGLDQRLIEIARVGDGVLDGVAGDFVEADAMDVDALERVLVLEHRADMPGDRFALAIRVGGEIQGLGALQGLGYGANLFVAASVGLPVHGEVMVRPNAAILGRQIAHMAKTGKNRISAAEITVDGLGFGGGFDNDDI